MRDHAPLILLAEPATVVTGRYTRTAVEGRARLAAGLAERAAASGATVERIAAAPVDGFHWGRWFAAAARGAIARIGTDGVLAYATAGSLALVDDEFLATLLAPEHGGVVANNRFSADAFAVRGDLERAIGVLENAPSDNAAVRILGEAGFAITDLSQRPWASADADTPQDLALLELAGVAAAADADRPALPRFDALQAVVTDRGGELVVAGRVSVATARYLETETACRVRLLIEERGMRSGPGVPRSILALLLERAGAAALVDELGRLGDVVVVDTRVLMASVARSSNPAHWPPPEERFASDFLDAEPVATPWLRALVETSVTSPAPILLGGHFLVNDGLRILVERAWAAAE